MEWHKSKVVSVAASFLKELRRNAIDEDHFSEMILAEMRKPSSFVSAQIKDILVPVSALMEDDRPFYLLYPCLPTMIERTQLNLPAKHVFPFFDNLPRSLLVQYPVGHAPVFGNHEVRAMVYLRTNDHATGGGGLDWPSGWDSFHFLLIETWRTDINETEFATVFLPSRSVDSDGSDLIFEDLITNFRLDKSGGGLSGMENDIFPAAYKTMVTLAMMAGNSDYVESIVLNKDRLAYERTGDLKYIEKAKKRGVFGFAVGKKLESIPHYRRPHFGIRWTGKGKTIPSLVPISGSIVNRKKMANVPTGYLGDADDDTGGNDDQSV